MTSSTTASGTGWTTSATGTTFKDLVVNDRAVPADVTPNTRFELPGYGYVVVNEQVRSEGGLTVTGLHVVVTTTTNPLHISRGIELKVSQAASSLSAPVLTRVRGYGYPGNVSIPFVDSWDPIDHWYHSEMPCLGTAGLRQTFTLEGWDGRWGGLTVGSSSRTLQSSVTDTSAVSKVSTTESSVNMLDGLVRATTIASDARVARTGSTYTVSSAGSRYSGLSVRGYPEIDGSVAPNTTITIPDVGTLYLNRVIRHANSVQLIAIRLVVTHPVAIGTEGGRMEAGTEYRIGDTKASVD